MPTPSPILKTLKEQRDAKALATSDLSYQAGNGAPKPAAPPVAPPAPPTPVLPPAAPKPPVNATVSNPTSSPSGAPIDYSNYKSPVTGVQVGETVKSGYKMGESTGMLEFDPNYVPKTREEAMNVSDKYQRNKLLANYYKSQGMPFDTSAFPSSFEEETAQFFDTQEKDTSLLEDQFDAAVSNAANKTRQNTGAITANMSQSREGVSSAGAPIARDQINAKQESEFNALAASIEGKKRQLKDLIKAQQEKYVDSRADQIAQMQMDLAKEQQKIQENAQKQTQLTKDVLDQIGTLSKDGLLAGLSPEDIQALSAEIPGMSSNLLQVFSNAATRAKATTTQQTNFDNTIKTLGTFRDLVNSGVSLTPDMMMSFSKSTGMPVESFLSFNEQAKAIMADKGMDQIKKSQEIQKLGMELDREARGIVNADLQKVDYINRLRKEGKSEQEVSEVKKMLGIDDANDPLYQADLQIKQADARIKDAQSRGVPVSPGDWKTYYEAQQAKREIVGGAVYVPKSNAYDVAQVGDGIHVGVEVDQNGGQCGAFVNQVFGTKIMGNTIQSKMKNVDPSILLPDAGMAFVMPGTNKNAPHGHTGIIETVNPDGSINVVESNLNDNEKVTRRTMSPDQVIAAGGGFVRPPNAEVIQGAGQGSQYQSALAKIPKNLITPVTTKANQFDGEQQIKNFQIVQTGKAFMDSIPNTTVNPADNQGIIYAFAKIMDPNSVVREGEYATVQKYAQSWADTFGFNAVRVVAGNQFLTEQALKNMKETIQRKYDAEKKTYDQIRNQYIKTIDNMAGQEIGSKILQDYSIDMGSENSDEDLYRKSAEAITPDHVSYYNSLP